MTVAEDQLGQTEILPTDNTAEQAHRSLDSPKEIYMKLYRCKLYKYMLMTK